LVKIIPTISKPPLDPPDCNAIPIPVPPKIPPIMLAVRESLTIGIAGIGIKLRNNV
jgi:hypothetical protein